MRAAISPSSRWSSPRLSTLSKATPVSNRSGRECDHSRPFFFWCSSPRSVHLDVEFPANQIQHLLPDPALGPGIGRAHGILPGLALIVGQIMQRGLARLLDLGQRILV